MVQGRVNTREPVRCDRAERTASRRIQFPFEIDLEGEYDDWYRIEGAQSRVVAGDGNGNQFVQVDDGPIVFVDHEARAGVLAENVQEFFELVVNAPYWRDLLKFSGGGQLSEMRRVQPLLEQGLEEDDRDEEFYDPGDKVAERRPFLLKALGLASDIDVVGRLHEAVSKPRPFRIIGKARDGEPEFELLSLFNDNVIEDNPRWGVDDDDDEGDG